MVFQVVDQLKGEPVMPEIPEAIFKRRNKLIDAAKKEVAERVKELQELEKSGGLSVGRGEKKKFDSILKEISDRLKDLENFGDPHHPPKPPRRAERRSKR
jgi:hypothetical protein